MSKCKIVVDSDDEDEGGGNLTVSENEDEVNRTNPQGSPSVKRVECLMPSATSTDILSHEIHEAHLSLLEQTPSVPQASRRSVSMHQSFAQDSPSETQVRSRRARTTEIPKLHDEDKGFGAHHDIRAFESHDVFEFHGGSDAEDEGGPKRKRRRLQAHAEITSQDSRASRQTSPTGNAIDSRLPETPSPLLIGQARKQTQSSHTSTIPTIPSTSPLGLTDAHRKSRKDAAEGLAVGQIPDALNPSSPSASVFSPNNRKTGSFEQDTDSVERGEQDDSCPLFYTAGSTRPIALLQEQRQPDNVEKNTAAASSDPASVKAPRVTQNQGKESQVDDQIDELGFGEDLIGLSKDQYKPRISRSRRRKDEELVIPTDFSKRPEAAPKPKRKSKRSKTTAFLELMPKDEEDEEDENPPLDIPELEIPKFNGKTEPDEAEGQANQNGEEAAEKNDPAKAPKKQRGRPKKGAEPKTVSGDMAEDNTIPGLVEHSANSPAYEKPLKRRRRSKRSLGVVEDGSESENNGSDRYAEDEDLRCPEKAKKRLQLMDGNIASVTTPGKPAKVNAAPEIAPPPGTPSKSPADAMKGPTKHSPISTSKVSYRVGLSKRARIQPLLSIVRK